MITKNKKQNILYLVKKNNFQIGNKSLWENYLTYEKLFIGIEDLLIKKTTLKGEDVEKVDAVIKARFSKIKESFDALEHCLATQLRNAHVPTKE